MSPRTLATAAIEDVLHRYPRDHSSLIMVLQDIQTSISQIEGGKGVDHEQARATVLKRIGR